MKIFQIFDFKGMILPFIDSNDIFYIFVENKSKCKILINLISNNDINKFISLEDDDSEIISCGLYKNDLKLKIFYMGRTLFEFNSNDIKKENLSFYSNYIIKNIFDFEKTSFTPSFLNGCEILSKSKTSQQFFIKFVDIDSNTIVHEDTFCLGERYHLNVPYFINYEISIFNTKGKCIFKYYMDLHEKNIWFKIKSNALSKTSILVESVNKFRIEHNCNVFCTTFFNNNFVDRFPSIKFVDPDGVLEEKQLFAIYSVNKVEEILGNKNI